MNHNLRSIFTVLPYLKIQFPEEYDDGPEIYPFDDPDMPDTITIYHDPVILRLPVKRDIFVYMP